MANNNSIKDDILKTISILRSKPLVIYCGEKDYYSCRIFTEGYFWGLRNVTGIDFVTDMGIWFAKKYNVSASTPYGLFPECFHKDESDEKKKEILLDLIELYFNENL